MEAVFHALILVGSKIRVYWYLEALFPVPSEEKKIQHKAED